MKRRISIMLAVALSCLLAVAICACSPSSGGEESSREKLEVTVATGAQMQKISAIAEAEGVKEFITVYYTDEEGTKRQVTDYTLADTNGLFSVGTATVTVRYKGLTQTFDITVVEKVAQVTVTFLQPVASPESARTTDVTVNQNSTVQEPTVAEVDGWIFHGWYHDINNGSSFRDYSQPWNFATDTADKNINIVAKWEQYTVGLQYESIAEGEEYAVTAAPDNFNGQSIRVPSLYNGKPVTQVKAEAFKDLTKVTLIFFGANVEQIGDGAFAGCTSLRELYFPSSLKTLGTNLGEGITASRVQVYFQGTQTAWGSLTYQRQWFSGTQPNGYTYEYKGY